MKLCFISSSIGRGRIRSREFGAVMAGGAEGRSGTRATRTYKYRRSGGVGATSRRACNSLFCQELDLIDRPGKGLPTDYTDCKVPIRPEDEIMSGLPGSPFDSRRRFFAITRGRQRRLAKGTLEMVIHLRLGIGIPLLMRGASPTKSGQFRPGWCSCSSVAIRKARPGPHAAPQGALLSVGTVTLALALANGVLSVSLIRAKRVIASQSSRMTALVAESARKQAIIGRYERVAPQPDRAGRGLPRARRDAARVPSRRVRDRDLDPVIEDHDSPPAGPMGLGLDRTMRAGSALDRNAARPNASEGGAGRSVRAD